MANFLVFSNNAGSTLAGSISNSATTLVLAAGTGALFPNPAAGQAFRLTLTDAATGTLHEIVEATARSGDTLTIVRAQEGTTARAWSAGDLAEHWCTAGSMGAMIQTSQVVLFNVKLFSTSTRSSMTGAVGNSYAVQAWAGTYTKASPSSQLIAWLATPSYTPGATGAVGTLLSIGTVSQQQLAANSIPGDARGQTATNVLFTGLGAGLLNWSLVYNRFDLSGWTTIFCPDTSDNAYFPSSTTATLIIGEING